MGFDDSEGFANLAWGCRGFFVGLRGAVGVFPMFVDVFLYSRVFTFLLHYFGATHEFAQQHLHGIDRPRLRPTTLRAPLPVPPTSTWATATRAAEAASCTPEALEPYTMT